MSDSSHTTGSSNNNSHDFNHNHNNNGSSSDTFSDQASTYIANEGRFSDTATLTDLDAPNINMKKYGLNASMRQIHYSENKLALDNLINKTIDLIYDLVHENKERPIFYPASDKIVKSTKSLKSLEKQKQIDEGEEIDLRILKLNLQLSPLDLNNGLNSLDKSSISVLLEQKLTQQVKFLLNLKDRIDDTSSKVFVTGDLNAGKSTFCNALLRRKVLPEDQQPCTSVFCEIIDASKDNNSVEEVHAIAHDSVYDIKDESTYEVFKLEDLENLVYEHDKYSILKVYLNDVRPKEQSLLCNGVIDIRLIDAPGLNMDLYQTTQVFSRQEEIDLVIFVVNSENHFTLSGKEFISAAAGEKQYLFIVSNKFDNIRDKERCKQKILEQVKGLSPESYKDSKDFVHFVSSTDVLDNDGGDDGPGDDDPDMPANPDFDQLEASLRKFVLEKRAVSKLLPAKSFLINLLKDLKTLAQVNHEKYTKEKDESFIQLKTQIAPHYDDILNKSIVINDSILKLIENTCSSVYSFTRKELNDSINNLGDSQVIEYPGIQFAYEYAQETQRVMIQSILSAVGLCEGHAKLETSEKVEEIIQYGKQTLGDEFLNDKKFQADMMFSRRKDSIRKNLSNPIEFGDFFDPSLDSFLSWIGLPSGLYSRSVNTLSDYNPTSIITKLPMTAITLREQLPTQLTLHTLYSSTSVLAIGTVLKRLYSLSRVLSPRVIKKITGPLLLGATGLALYYLISDIPNAFPRKQARKIRAQVEDLEYIHENSDRISKECRKVLNYPLRQVMNNFQTSIDKRGQEKEKIELQIQNSNMSLSYFDQLIEKIDYEYKLLDNVNLESVNTVD